MPTQSGGPDRSCLVREDRLSFFASRLTYRNRDRTQRNEKRTGADERTRTSTGLLPQRPERCASAIPPHPHFPRSAAKDVPSCARLSESILMSALKMCQFDFESPMWDSVWARDETIEKPRPEEESVTVNLIPALAESTHCVGGLLMLPTHADLFLAL